MTGMVTAVGRRRSAVGSVREEEGWAEFLCGPGRPLDAGPVRGIVDACVPVTEEDAAAGARLHHEAGRRRGTLGDCLLAAVAMRREAALATANQADFRRFVRAGLMLAEM